MENIQKLDIIRILEDSKSARCIFLVSILIIGLIIRLYFFPSDVPLFNDSQAYFWYAIDTSILNQFPDDHTLTNNGWPVFLSLFFKFIDSDNFLDYQNIQRMIGLVFSIATIVPIYFLCARFVKKSYALLGAALIIFEPRLIQSSIIGTPEPMYIFLVSTSLMLFFSQDIRRVYISFFLIGVISLVRYEGILLLIPFIAMFLLRFKNKKNLLVKIFVCLAFTLILLVPTSILKNESIGQDGVVSQISAGPQFYQKSIETDNSSIERFVYLGIINLVKYLGWSQIPMFLIFAPIGIFFLLKKRDVNKNTLFFCLIVMLIPAFYAYSREFMDVKYIFVVFPIFSVLSCYTLHVLFEKINKRNLLFFILIISIITSSVIFLEWKTVDNEHYRETFQILSEISKRDIVINVDFGTYGGEVTYLHWTRLSDVGDFPILKKSLPTLDLSIPVQAARVEKEQSMQLEKRIYPEWRDKMNIDSFDEYLPLLKEQNVTHLLIDETNTIRLINNNLREELVYVFHNENEFPFLTKEYDSRENGYNYHLKLFKINYDVLEKFQLDE